MKLVLFLALGWLLLPNLSFGQTKTTADSSYLLSFNQAIDDAVIKKDTAWLKQQYAPDFVFSHGSGRVEGRQGWLTSVAKGGFLQRQHDSVTVELHGKLAIVKGTLHVKKQNKEKLDSYHLKYVKLYAKRKNKWQVVSHSTVSEYHD